MTEETSHVPVQPRVTQEDVDGLVAFIKARVAPLREAVRYDSEEYKGFQALLDLSVHIKGSAQVETARGDEPYLEFHHLVTAAKQWSDHPDFLPTWDPYGVILRFGDAGDSRS